MVAPEGKRDVFAAYGEKEKASMLLRGYILELLIKEAEMEEEENEAETPLDFRSRKRRSRL